MSRTYRRKSGDRHFVYSVRDERDNNPYYGRSNVERKLTVKHVKRQSSWGKEWCWLEQKYIPRVYIEPVAVYKHTYIDNPRDHYEMLEAKLDSINWQRKMERDGYINESRRNQALKHQANSERRSDTKRELARISKIKEYEDMHFVDSKRKSDRWSFF